MAVRETLSTLLEATVSGVRSALNEESAVDLGPLERRLAEIEATATERLDRTEGRIAALEKAGESLEKRLSMTMGAIQAATAQLVQLREALAHTQNQAQQAMQRATSAQSAAETAADGVGTVEAELSSLRTEP